MVLIVLIMAPFDNTNAQYTNASASFTINVSPASVIKITPTTPITLYIGPTVAGSISTNPPNSDTYLKVTSITSGNNKKVDAQITNGTIPSGTLLKVKASLPTNTTGKGTFGYVSNEIILSNTASPIIQGMGTCYTGIGTQDGYNLTYSWVLNPNVPAHLVAYTTSAIFITYTISLY